MSNETQIDHVEITVPVVRNSEGKVCCHVYHHASDTEEICVGFVWDLSRWGDLTGEHCSFGCTIGDVEGQSYISPMDELHKCAVLQALWVKEARIQSSTE